jgi:carbon storage regulator
MWCGQAGREEKDTMLVLTRRPGEEIVIGGGIRITVVGIKEGQVRVGVSAPPWVTVDRGEVAQRRTREAAASEGPAEDIGNALYC